VGDLTIDHNLTASDPLAAEQYVKLPQPRPVLFVSDANPGSDLIAEVVSAFAATSLVFKDRNNALALQLREHARNLYKWMKSDPQARS
jgi:hypothetical protein